MKKLTSGPDVTKRAKRRHELTGRQKESPLATPVLGASGLEGGDVIVV
jgi:hypothetical protein